MTYDNATKSLTLAQVNTIVLLEDTIVNLLSATALTNTDSLPDIDYIELTLKKNGANTTYTTKQSNVVAQGHSFSFNIKVFNGKPIEFNNLYSELIVTLPKSLVLTNVI